MIIPTVNAEEACLGSGLRVIAVSHLLELVGYFNARMVIAPYKSSGLLHQPKPYPD